MKKLTCMILALCLLLAMTACGKKAPEETTPTQQIPGSALEIMETVWAGYGDGEKPSVIGGSMANPVEGGPGAFDLTDESISYNLLIPAEQLANVTEAASMINMLNPNFLTGAVYKLADGVAAADFGAAMKEAVLNNPWMCGFPETLVIQDIAGSYVLVVFGLNDMVDPFLTHMGQAYPDAAVLTQESIA